MGKGISITGLVLAILGLVVSFLSVLPFVSIFALVISIVGLVLSVVGGKKLRANNLSKGLATAGLVIGIIAVVSSSIGFATCGACQICAVAGADETNSLVEEFLDESGLDLNSDINEILGEYDSLGDNNDNSGTDNITSQNNESYGSGDVDLDMSELLD